MKHSDYLVSEIADLTVRTDKADAESGSVLESKEIVVLDPMQTLENIRIKIRFALIAEVPAEFTLQETAMLFYLIESS